MRRMLVITALCGGLLVAAGCNRQEASSGASPTSEAGAGALTRADGEAFLAAMRLGGTQGDVYNMCVADKVKARVDAGGLAPDDVRAWSTGRAPSGPVQDFITSNDVVVPCSRAAAGSTTTTG